MDTLYERFGGLGAVARLVFAFYDRVLQSKRLAPYFADIDMCHLIDHQAKFLSSVMGGSATYTDAQLCDIHAHLHIDDGAFKEMMLLLEATLKEFGLSTQDADRVMVDVRSRRPHIELMKPDVRT